jgi:hypothetical protein
MGSDQTTSQPPCGPLSAPQRVACDHALERTASRARGCRSVLTSVTALFVGVALAACGSSSSSSSRVAVRQACQHVAAVLSDGPDPSVDPVGYAEAQVLPLRQIHTSQEPLQEMIDKLASAYHEFSSEHGSRSAKAFVTVAGRQIDAVCPGATE